MAAAKLWLIVGATMAAVVLGLITPLMYALVLVLILALVGLVLAAPIAVRQLDYRRRWLEAVQLLTESDEARDQAGMRADKLADIASDRQRKINAWQTAAGEVDVALEAIRSESWSAGWDAYAAELLQAGHEERAQAIEARRVMREEQGRQQALRRLQGT